jgi:hypothetical protein
MGYVETVEIACNYNTIAMHLTDHHFLCTLQYLFWSGRIAMGKTIQALIPLDLMERFTDAVQNASIAFKPAFSPIPVTM